MSEKALRKRFERLRAAESAAAPTFEHTLTRARARSDRGRASRTPGWLLAAGACAALVLALVLVVPQRTPVADLDPGRWALPSDALLLDLPGSSVLRDLPESDTILFQRYSQ